MKRAAFLISLCAVVLTAMLPAQDQPQKRPHLSLEQKQKLVDGLKWQTGTVSVGDGRATINLANNYRFLNSEDTHKVLTDLWGNPPSHDMGLIFPHGSAPGHMIWAAIVERFEEEGYVKDDDADKLDPDKMLKEFQEAQKQASEEAVKEGYANLELAGWAMKPKYDKETKKLTWALDLVDVDSGRHSVNYYIRILGRRGFLVLNALGGIESLPTIEKDLPELLAMVNFNEGHRYADFNPKTDKVAAYGIAGLITAAVGLKLLKLGIFALFFKKIGLIFVAGWKLIVVGVGAIGAFFKKLFGKKDASGQAS